MKATFPGVKMMVSGGVAGCFHRPMGDGRMTLLDMAPDFAPKSPVAKGGVQKQKVQNAAVVLANQDIAANHLFAQQDLVTLAGRVAVTLLNQRAVRRIPWDRRAVGRCAERCPSQRRQS